MQHVLHYEDIAMKTIFVLGCKCSISTSEDESGALFKTLLAFFAYRRGDSPSELVTASSSLSGELLCITAYSKRTVYTAVILPGVLHISCATRVANVPTPPAAFLRPLAELAG